MSGPILRLVVQHALSTCLQHVLHASHVQSPISHVSQSHVQSHVETYVVFDQSLYQH